MREPEKYWLYKGPPIPEVTDLPPGVFKGDETAWCSLSPGMRRTIWREATKPAVATAPAPPSFTEQKRSLLDARTEAHFRAKETL